MGTGLTGDSEVVVHDVGVDAALVEVAGEPVLMLRPSMSFGAAVQAVRGVAPHLSADEASAMVRHALPQMIDLSEMLDLPVAACGCPPAPGADTSSGLVRTMRGQIMRVVGGSVVAGLIGFGATHVMHLHSDMAVMQAQVKATNDARADTLVAQQTAAEGAREGVAAAPTIEQLEQMRFAAEVVLAEELPRRGAGSSTVAKERRQRQRRPETDVRGNEDGVADGLTALVADVLEVLHLVPPEEAPLIPEVVPHQRRPHQPRHEEPVEEMTVLVKQPDATPPPKPKPGRELEARDEVVEVVTLAAEGDAPAASEDDSTTGEAEAVVDAAADPDVTDPALPE